MRIDAVMKRSRPAAAQHGQQRAAQLSGGKGAGIQYQIGAAAHRLQHGALPRHRVLDGAAVPAQRMAAPRLLVAVDDGLGVRLQKQQPAPQPLGAYFVHGLRQPLERLSRPHVVHERQPVIPSACRLTEFGELHHHLCRKVVHNVVPAVLQTDGGAALPRPGQSRNNKNFHLSVLHSVYSAFCFPASLCHPIKVIKQSAFST